MIKAGVLLFGPHEVHPDRADYFPENVTTVVLPESYILARSRVYAVHVGFLTLRLELSNIWQHLWSLFYHRCCL